MTLEPGFFRNEFARLVGVLTRRFGRRHLEVVEDAVADALLRATELWQEQGTPTDPSAWLARVARNRLIDLLRRARTYQDAVEPRLLHEQVGRAATDPDANPHLDLLIACADPAMPMEGRLTLALRTAFGLSVREIARLTLASYETTQKRLYRARERLRQSEGPPGPKSVCADTLALTLYLVFTSAYQSAAVPEGEGFAEGIDLAADVLSRVDELLALPDVVPHERRGDFEALGALICFHLARLVPRERIPALPLPDVDRSSWDRALLAEGAERLSRAKSDGGLSRYHIEAAIAAEYSLPLSWDAIDWQSILAYYDRLQALGLSRTARLSRAIARFHAASDETAREEARAEALRSARTAAERALVTELSSRGA